MTLNDLAHTPDRLPRPHGRPAAEAAAWFLPNPADKRILIDGTRPTASPTMIRTALGTLAVNHHDVPRDLQFRLLACYSPTIAARARAGLFQVLCDLVDDLYGLASVDGYADRFRDDGDPAPDVHALLAVTESAVDETLRMLAPDTTPGRVA